MHEKTITKLTNMAIVDKQIFCSLVVLLIISFSLRLNTQNQIVQK